MNTLLSFILFFTPSFIGVPLRRLAGNKIGKGSKIKFGTYLSSSNYTIGDHTIIGPFSIIRGESLTIGKHCILKPLTVLSARKIQLNDYVQTAPLSIITGDWTPQSSITIGDHSRVFPFCWIDTGLGVTIGKHVGIGGHTLIFTHGVWTNYLQGGPVTFAPVEIKDNVWLPWRVFIMPGVTIGTNCIIGANSLVTKSIPNNALAAGSPAKILKENNIQLLDSEELTKRTFQIFSDFASYYHNQGFSFTNQKVITPFGIISTDLNDRNNQNIIFLPQSDPALELNLNDITQGNNIIYHPWLVGYISHETKLTKLFIPFLRRYGIRLSIN